MCVHLTTVFMEDVGEAVQNAVTAATVGASFLNPFAVRNGTTPPTGRQAKHIPTKLSKQQPCDGGDLEHCLPDALVVLAAPPCEERKAGAEAAQDTGPSVLTAAATLLSTCKEKGGLSSNRQRLKRFLYFRQINHSTHPLLPLGPACSVQPGANAYGSFHISDINSN